MATKSTRNSGKPWTDQEIGTMRTMAKKNTPTRVIALKVGRSEEAVRKKAQEQEISLKPTNQSPYNRRKK